MVETINTCLIKVEDPFDELLKNINESAIEAKKCWEKNDFGVV